MIDSKTLLLLAAIGLPLGACAPSPDDTQIVPPPSLLPAESTEPEPKSTKVFDMNEDGTASAGEVAGGVLGVAVIIAVCPFCVLGM
ncbi:hypothetical protein [uncultured Tateyamaria sp.]|uniref:hypothetical protein n=1 Tax=uncultured Tateyamaria sp. TaxID=455651 RepID=UPI002606A081|nr:hypothetical protein [uncultured Tateyamaria sp.]